MMIRNIFKEIIDRKLPATIVHEDDHCLAFRDISPAAPTHILIIPKKEIRTHADLSNDDAALIGRLHLVARDLAQKEGLRGYRVVINCGEEGGQTVPHLHLHLLGGRGLQWPPG